MADQAAILRDPLLARRALRLAEFVNDADRATAMSMRLAELAPSDGAAAAAASGWLTRTGNPLLALHYASLAIKLGAQVNVAANLGAMSNLLRIPKKNLQGRYTTLRSGGRRMTKQRSLRACCADWKIIRHGQRPS